jgi:hypothetical protein
MTLFWTLVIYVYISYCWYIIAQKTNTKDEWFAWIPIASIYLLLKIAGKPGWWFILLFIPIVNLVVIIIVWIEIAKRRQKPGWLGLLALIPLINLPVYVVLAFIDETSTKTNVSFKPQAPPEPENTGQEFKSF